MTEKSVVNLTMNRDFNVEPEKLFEAWTNPDLFRNWFMTLQATNKVAKNDLQIGGEWEVVDHRQGQDFRAIGTYKEIVENEKLVFTFKMPQFSEYEDTLSVVFDETSTGTNMTFSHDITVLHEPDLTEDDIQKAEKAYRDSTEEGYNYMFMGLKELVETEKVSYTG
ncbi:SRPBCC family protein [Jeotgalicoccus marinus]|uniref:SRPBCC family protein n=1 Tax=Jeotgalicoccus marinus TaxID=516700 RepID=UPI000416CE5A|nr:SRPBCC domain-containing protein [Jeotgalicoccus marinus]